MEKQDIKYQPLQSYNFDLERETDTKCENVPLQIRVHWTFKLLFVAFIIVQIIYVGHNSEFEFSNRNTSQLQGSIAYNSVNIITISDLEIPMNSEQINSVTHKENLNSVTILKTPINDLIVYSVSTTTSPSAISNQSQINQTFFGTLTDNIINDSVSTITNINIAYSDTTSSTNVNEANDKDLSLIQNSSSDVGLEKNQTLKKSHEKKNLTTNTSIANYSNGTTTKYANTLTSTLTQWNTAIYSPPTTTAPHYTPAMESSNAISNNSQMDKRQYYINTSKCHIPYIDPFTPEVRKIFKPSHGTGCTRDNAIISVSFDEVKGQYILHINYTVVMSFVKNSHEHFVVDDLQCCYRQIERSGSGAEADEKFTLLPCTNFHQDFLVPVHIQGVIIDCSSKSMKRLLQQDAFSFIQVNRTSDNAKSSSLKNSLPNGPRKLGVLLIGIDSLSRINFRRNMPETLKYLMDSGWYELQGYNKIGDNTLPNIMPLLAGYTKNTTDFKCKPTQVGGLDTCNFIWNKFKEHGFKTAYAEDTTFISTFNYQLKGFLKPPTDHYFRPIAMGIERKMKKKRKASLNYCIGRRQAGEYIYDYGLEFATRYRNQSNFGLFWTNSFSHNSFSTAATMDGTMMRYLKELEIRGILEQSVVVFFSDHGRRWGPLLNLVEGFLEERLPMLFISLPSWLEREYPEYVRNVKLNQKRLVTPFDIYMTLQELLHMAAPEYHVAQADDCAKAQSIFREIPENRTCADSCIPEAWCTCLPYITASPKDVAVHRVTQLIINEMNRYFVAKNITSLCSELSLEKISRARVREADISEQKNTSTYLIEFVTNPKTKPSTEFSATANYDRKQDKIQLNVDDIARHSEYKNTAKCTNDNQAKKYCICRDSLKS